MEYNVKIFARKKNINLRTVIHTETDGNHWSLEDLLIAYAKKVVEKLNIDDGSKSLLDNNFSKVSEAEMDRICNRISKEK